jgi:predicted component of type VI protein secretion system
MARACVVGNVLGGGGIGMAEREFRLPGSPYEELVNIIVAYGTRDEAARAGDVGKLDSAHQSSVSRNNAFLTEIGVLQGESKKLITRRGRSLAVALARKDRAEVRSNWRAIVAASEFLQNVVSAVKLREGMLYPTVQAYIAHAAGQPRNKPVMNGAGAIIEILKASGMLKEEAGELVATFDERGEDLAPEDGSPAQTFETNESVVSATVAEVAGTPAGATLVPSPTVSIHVQVRCTPDEIEDLAPRLKALLRDLSTEP